MRYAVIPVVAALAAIPAIAQAPKAEPTAVAEPASLAEAPLWPIGMRLSDEMVGDRAAKQKNRGADVLIWLPPGANRIRAMGLVPNNTDSKHFFEHAGLRKTAVKHEMGIVYLRTFYTGIEYHHAKPVETLPAAPDNILKVLGLVAKETGIVEFRHAPWITFGKSSRGEFPFRMGWLYPKRTIAGISYHGETPTWPVPKWAKLKDETILYASVNGQEEWSGTWYRHVRPCLLNYRAQTAWLPHQSVIYGIGHGNYPDWHMGKDGGEIVPPTMTSRLKVWDYLAVFVEKALTLRLPAKGYPTDGPLELRQVAPASGYLIHPRAPEQLLGMKWHAFRYKDGQYQLIPWPDEKHPVLDPEQGTVDPKLLIRKVIDVPEADRKKLFWVADREQAEAWLKLHNIKDTDTKIP